MKKETRKSFEGLIVDYINSCECSAEDLKVVTKAMDVLTEIDFAEKQMDMYAEAHEELEQIMDLLKQKTHN